MTATIIFLTYKLTILKKNVQVRTQEFKKIRSVSVKQNHFFPIYRVGFLVLLVGFVVADSNSVYNGYVGPCPTNIPGPKFTPVQVIYFVPMRAYEQFNVVQMYFSHTISLLASGTLSPAHPIPMNQAHNVHSKWFLTMQILIFGSRLNTHTAESK